MLKRLLYVLVLLVVFANFFNQSYAHYFTKQTYQITHLNNKDKIKQVVTGDKYSVILFESGKLSIFGKSPFDNNEIAKQRNVARIHLIKYVGKDVLIMQTNNKKLNCIGATKEELGINKWNDIQKIVATRDGVVLGLKDGIIYVGGNGKSTNESQLKLETSTWSNIKDIAILDDNYDIEYETSTIVGVKVDGTVEIAGNNIFQDFYIDTWKDIVGVKLDVMHIVAVDNNGLVYAIGKNKAGQRNVGQWTDIVKVAGTKDTTVGLRRDGTVVATGIYSNEDFKNWNSITDLYANDDFVLGIRADGMMLVLYAFEDNVDNTTKDSEYSIIIYDKNKKVDVSKWAVSHIKSAIEKGLIDNYEDLKYKDTISRKEICKLAVKLYEKLDGSTTSANVAPFTDVNDLSIDLAYELGIMNGLSDTLFGPDEKVTREQAAVILFRTMKVINSELEKYTNNKKIKSIDEILVSKSAYVASAYMAERGIISISDNKFNPQKQLTVEEAIILINRIYDSNFKSERYVSNKPDNTEFVDGIVDINGLAMYDNNRQMYISDYNFFDTTYIRTEAERKNKLNALYDSSSFYNDYIAYLKDIKEKTKDLNEFVNIIDIGVTEQGRKNYALVLGNMNSKIKVMINSTHHQVEYVNTILNLEQIEDIVNKYRLNQNYGGVNVRKMLSTSQIWFIPLVNPDGMEIYNNYRLGNYTLAKGEKILDVTKTNANRVNLNRNYDANFRIIDYSCGPKPFSEKETIMMKNLYEKIGFNYSVAYHSAGEIIFWYYGQTGPLLGETTEVANLIRNKTGYRLSTDEKASNADFGGFKDWVIKEKKMPAVTIETGVGSMNGVRKDWSEYYSIWNKNKDVPLEITRYYFNRLISQNNVREKYINTFDIQYNNKIYSGDIVVIDSIAYVDREEIEKWLETEELIYFKKKDVGLVYEANTEKIGINGREFVPIPEVLQNTNYVSSWDEGKQGIIILKKEISINMINKLEISALIKGDTIVYASLNKSKAIGTINKGEAVTLIRDRQEKWAKIKTDKIEGWIDYTKINVIEPKKQVLDPLSNKTKEQFIAQNKFISDTNKIIWINQERLSVNVFENRNNKWTLIKEMGCSVGKSETPTINGVFKYYKLVPIERFESGYYVENVIKFYEAYGIHSVLLRENGTIYDGRIGGNISHGCVRVPKADAEWLKNNIPMGTTVVVW